MYSIEPPLYFFLNEACRLRNQNVVPLLGPFAAAVATILDGNAEYERPDKIKEGCLQSNSPLGCMAGAFLLFRGALLPPHAVAKFAMMQGRRLFNVTKTDQAGKEWGKDLRKGDDAKWVELTPEKKMLAGFVCLPGATSTSVSFKVALEFAMPSQNTNHHVSTLFVICCHNYGLGLTGFKGFRMDSALHSAHPYEQEVLLMEGVRMAVLAQDDIIIDNSMTSSDPFWISFKNKTISVIYLFHASE